MELLLNLDQLGISLTAQVCLVLLGVKVDLGWLPIELTKNLSVEELFTVQRVSRPERTNLLFRNSGTPCKVSHHFPVLLPGSEELTSGLSGEESDHRINLVFQEIIQGLVHDLSLI